MIVCRRIDPSQRVQDGPLFDVAYPLSTQPFFDVFSSETSNPLSSLRPIPRNYDTKITEPLYVAGALADPSL